LLRFQRCFTLKPSALRVDDSILFLRPIRFSELYLVIVPLFPEWRIDRGSPLRLECDDFELTPHGTQISSAGTATLWGERLVDTSFKTGYRIQRRYTYRWDPTQ